jgi:Fic family protein
LDLAERRLAKFQVRYYGLGSIGAEISSVRGRGNRCSRHFNEDDNSQLRIELLSDEAIKTSEIEGEFLDLASVQSSLRRQFGLSTDDRPARPQEWGIAEMMADVYRNWHEPLRHEELFRWHAMLMTASRHIEMIGAYRQHEDAVQIVSGRLDKPTIHFEAPPSRQVPVEMESFTFKQDSLIIRSDIRHRPAG